MDELYNEAMKMYLLTFLRGKKKTGSWDNCLKYPGKDILLYSQGFYYKSIKVVSNLFKHLSMNERENDHYGQDLKINVNTISVFKP